MSPPTKDDLKSTLFRYLEENTPKERWTNEDLADIASLFADLLVEDEIATSIMEEDRTLH